MNATALNDINTCEAWSAAESSNMASRDNPEIKGWLGITWAVIGLALLMGPRSVGPVTAITTPLKWLMLFVCLGMYINL